MFKSDSSVHISEDYKLTVNQAYPLPIIEDLLALLFGGKSFSKLNLAHAYQQIELDEESRKYVIVNTNKGHSTPVYHLVWLLLQQCFIEQWRTFSNNLIMYAFIWMAFLLQGHLRQSEESSSCLRQARVTAGVRLKRSKYYIQ